MQVVKPRGLKIKGYKIKYMYCQKGHCYPHIRGNSLGKFGVTITNGLRWNTCVGNICTKANRTLGFLKRNLSSCPREVKELAYKGLMRPILENAGPVWDPSGKTLQDKLEKAQNRAARFETGNCNFETEV